MVIFHSYVKLPEGTFWADYNLKVILVTQIRRTFRNNFRRFACDNHCLNVPSFPLVDKKTEENNVFFPSSTRSKSIYFTKTHIWLVK